MEISLIMNTARSAVIEVKDGGVYYTKENYEIIVNGKTYGIAEQVITSDRKSVV